MEGNVRYVVDEIIDNKVLLESLNDKNKLVVDISLFIDKIYEGAVVIKKENIFIVDSDFEINRRKLINNKLNKLKELD